MNTTTTIDLDRQRAAFEAWHRQNFPDVEFKLLLGAYAVTSLTPRPHGSFAVNERWKAWNAALARRSNAGEVAGIKTWQERAQLEFGEGWMRAGGLERHMYAEIADLRAALATQQAAREQQEPVTKCATCNGTGIVDDGEIDCYPNGEPYMCGPVKCVKDCPSCKQATIAQVIEPAALAAPVAQQSEAGAPTAAAEQIRNDALEEAARLFEQPIFDPNKVRQITTEIRALKSNPMPPTSGRESAAPAAPVREGDREQDAKDAALLRTVVEKGMQLHFEGRDNTEDDAVWVNDLMKWSDGDRMGATRALIEQEAKNLEAIDAAMQKGAQR